MSRKPSIALAAIVMLVATPPRAGAAEFATPKEAEALVAKAVTAIKAHPQKTYEEITAKDPKWIDRDLYPVVYGLDGKVLAHGLNPKMVGKDLIELKDADGKAFVKERVELAQSKGKFWQDYKFTEPTTRKVLPKQMYCEKLNDTAVCAGVYKH
ncbi:cache domain-containing protein [Aquabacterium sp.]|uniref:cache domain-containing protein n=1 Tax=Aquabacterium sp. TaxID=1872578 RepID=UPI002BF3474E|nr:cache domain-containing protein [Aquabacterium sp.]HSW03986.1 cache domain-containing protein [Aquabacterium sp.]